MRRGDIYLVSLDPTAGHEQSGSRPVLIVSPVIDRRIGATDDRRNGASLKR